jgi:hypothetical protein
VLADPASRLQLTSIDQAAIRAAIEDRAMLLAACEGISEWIAEQGMSGPRTTALQAAIAKAKGAS